VPSNFNVTVVPLTKAVIGPFSGTLVWVVAAMVPVTDAVLEKLPGGGLGSVMADAGLAASTAAMPVAAIEATTAVLSTRRIGLRRAVLGFLNKWTLLLGFQVFGMRTYKKRSK
jgi:hypothetical protein